MILGKQYLDSGVYTLTLEESQSLDLTSYVYTKYGTFRIVPVSSDVSDFTKLQGFEVYINQGYIGSAKVPSPYDPIYDKEEDLQSRLSQTLASAIDIVTTKINEYVDKEELETLSKIVSTMFDSINMTEEQRAMYRTFIIENGQVDDVIEEMNDPTDILGENSGTE